MPARLTALLSTKFVSTWKYWHAAMLHAKSMAVVIAYDIYKECAEGLMRAGEWKLNKIVSFHRFREKLATQMLAYDPKDLKYPGDERFRAVTSIHKSRRTKRKLEEDFSRTGSSSRTTASNRSVVSKETIKKESGKRLCGDLCPLIDHLESIKPTRNRNPKVCVVCGKPCYHMCTKCQGPDGKKGVAVHAAAPTKKDPGAVSCFFHYHNTSYFGLAREDYHMHGIAKKDWRSPTDIAQKEHYKEIRRVLNTPTGALLNSTNRIREPTTANTARPAAPTEDGGQTVTLEQVQGPSVPV